jgi:hypothetical protein
VRTRHANCPDWLGSGIDLIVRGRNFPAFRRMERAFRRLCFDGVRSMQHSHFPLKCIFLVTSVPGSNVQRVRE